MSLQAEVAKCLDYVHHCEKKMKEAFEGGKLDDAMFYARGGEHEFHKLAEILNEARR